MRVEAKGCVIVGLSEPFPERAGDEMVTSEMKDTRVQAF